MFICLASRVGLRWVAHLFGPRLQAGVVFDQPSVQQYRRMAEAWSYGSHH